jgi:hypothetical protein
MSSDPSADFEALMDRIESALNQDLGRPWCVHGLLEEVAKPFEPEEREDLLLRTRLAADMLVDHGRARFEPVNAIAIGVRCQDWTYWSARSPNDHLEQFGPEYETPVVLRRLVSHFQCHGL